MQYWLMKSEPDVFSIDDLKRVTREPWDGIRNYQARNFMRDSMAIGDLALFYHSNAKPPGIVGVMRICSQPYPDPTQFDAENKYFDAKSNPENPRWMLRDVEYVSHFPRLLSLSELREHDALDGMMLLKKGSRLSIQPVSEEHWAYINQLAEQ